MARSDAAVPQSSSSKKKRQDEESVTQDARKASVPLQRRRVWRACEACRRKKIKCDGVEPTCAQCQSSSSQCTWLVTKDRAALSRHYVQELEARLLNMEKLFTELTPVLEQVAPPSGPSATSADGQLHLSPEQIAKAATVLRTLHSNNGKAPASPTTSQSKSSDPDEEDVSESFGHLALDEYGHMRWIGGSSTMSLIQSFKAVTATSPPNRRFSPMEEDPSAPGPSVNKIYFPASVFFGKVRALPGPEEVEYPPRDLADMLVNAYFAQVHCLLPVIDKPSFLKQYNLLMQNTRDLQFHRTETAFIALVFAVFACAASLVQDPRLAPGGTLDDGGMGMVYYERALILQYISHAKTVPTHVQCFILLSSFLCSVNCLPQAWILIGQAVRTGQDVGLHRSPRRLQIPPVEKELRRKIWWGVYTLDRMLAVALGRPLGINDTDCDVEYPIEVDDDDLPQYFAGNLLPQDRTSLMTGFVLLIQLYQIAGRILREVYDLELCKETLEPEQKADLAAKVEALDQELTQWCDSLPPHLKNHQQTDAQVSISSVLCSHYYSVLTTLHRNLLPLKKGDIPIAPKSTVKAVSSARSCIKLAPSIKEVVPNSHHTAFFIQHLFSSAVILLLYAMHAPDIRASKAALDESKSVFAALESWEGRWPGATKCKDFLAELAVTAQESVDRRKPDWEASSSPLSPQPQTASPHAIEGGPKRSIKMASNPVPGLRRGSRRNSSKEGGGPSDRRLSAVSPYRSDARDRSTSRKRSDGIERRASFSIPLTSTPESQHNSPKGRSMATPANTLTDSQTSLGGSQHLTTSPIATTFPYTSPSALQRSTSSTSWEVESPAIDSMDIFNTDQPYNNAFAPGPAFSPIEAPLSYSEPFDQGFVPMVSTSFAAPGLPFRGLDYIKNFHNLDDHNVPSGFTSGGSSGPASGSNSTWPSSTYDPGAFEFNPDVPFSLGAILDGQNGGTGFGDGLNSNGSSS